MGADTAVISRNMYSELKRYVMTVLQEGVPLVDADYNDQMVSFYTQMRRLISNTVGDGARGVAFEIKQHPALAPNDFRIRGGDLVDDGPEELFLKGMQTQLAADETFMAGVETAPVSTGIVGNMLIDTAANFVPGALIGMTLTPNLAVPGTTLAIVDNSVTTITASGGITAVAGNRYRVAMTTPVAARHDLVLLDVFLDEIDSVEDPDLKHTIDSLQIESMRRKKLRQNVLVHEGITLPVVLAPGYTDSDGHRHVQVPLALITRPAGDPIITDPMITDLRRKIFRLDEIDDRYVNAAGDTMTGPLVMEADIVMGSGQRVTGLCVIDGNALCDEVVAQRHFDRTEHLLGDLGVVPTESEVQNLADPNHFEVHDNRYYTKGEIDGMVGSNMIANPSFEDGLSGWENAAPQALSGAPDAEVARCVRLSLGLCGSGCGGSICGCRTLKVHVEPCCRLCTVCILRQEIGNGSVMCGGSLLLVHTLCVTKGNEYLIPYMVLDLYSSCQYVGSTKVQMFTPTLERGGIVKEDGFVRLSRRVTVSPSVDQIVAWVCYEVIPRETPDEEYALCAGYSGSVPLVPRCEVGPEGLDWEICAVQIRKLGSLEGANEQVTGCQINPIPMIERALPYGRVEITPGRGQVSTLIEVLERRIGDTLTGEFPTDFPGVVLNEGGAPATVIDEVPVEVVPVKTCECIKECIERGGNELDLNVEMDPTTLPLIALNRDRTAKLAYWGQGDAALADADVVLTPAKFRSDSIVGELGNLGFDEDGVPIVGGGEDLARATYAKYGVLAYKTPPVAGCRNIWADLVYLDEALCLGVDLAKDTYSFFDSQCACFQIAATQEISEFVTDRCFPRVIPDDGFGGLPLGYPEAVHFAYCALPSSDVVGESENAFFRFRRETPECARPNQGYIVRVKITSKVLPLTVDWSEVLPAGHVLVSGVLAQTLVFTTVGEEQVLEYVVRTPAAGSALSVFGVAEAVGESGSQITLTSDPIQLSATCRSLAFVGFGSQSPNAAGRVFWAGGGRPDPVPGDVGLWVKVWAGRGSVGVSSREVFLTAGTMVPTGATSHTFQLAPNGTDGFAVGLPVWIFNDCFVTNPVRRIELLDIEEQEALAAPDEEITGLYGAVTAIDPVNHRVTVGFSVPPTADVDYTIQAKAEIMVAPYGSKGFYWEASPALVDMCGRDSNASRCIVRWDYRFWNSTKNPCPGSVGAAFVGDGDGESHRYDLQGDLVKDILNPVDWLDLWASPVRDVSLDVDANPADASIHVCDVCVFNPCDVIQIVDANCSGREANGSGFVTSVVEATEDVSGACAALKAAKGTLTLGSPIPTVVPGCPGFDMFQVLRGARVFVKPDVVRDAFTPTLECTPAGFPINPRGVCVDFATGKLVFAADVVVRNAEVCYRRMNSIVTIPNQDGIYFLRGIDKSGCVSPPSKPIKMTAAIYPLDGLIVHSSNGGVPCEVAKYLVLGSMSLTGTGPGDNSETVAFPSPVNGTLKNVKVHVTYWRPENGANRAIVTVASTGGLIQFADIGAGGAHSDDVTPDATTSFSVSRGDLITVEVDARAILYAGGGDPALALVVSYEIEEAP